MDAVEGQSACAEHKLAHGFGTMVWAGNAHGWSEEVIDKLCKTFLPLGSCVENLVMDKGWELRKFCGELLERFLIAICISSVDHEGGGMGAGGKEISAELRAISSSRFLPAVIFLVACKFKEDKCPLLVDLSEVMGMSVHDLRRAEIVLLQFIDFDIYHLDEAVVATPDTANNSIVDGDGEEGSRQGGQGQAIARIEVQCGFIQPEELRVKGYAGHGRDLSSPTSVAVSQFHYMWT